MKYRTVFISDLHLGNAVCQHENLLKFLKSLESEDGSSYEVEKLYLVGDIVDMLSMNHALFWNKHRTVIKKLLSMADKDVNIIYIPGNHDHLVRKEIFDEKEISSELHGIMIKKQAIHETADGKRLWILHGDEFDGAIRAMPWLYWIGDKSYGLALFVNKWYNRITKLFRKPYWSLSHFLKSKVKNVIKFINNFEKMVSEEARVR